MTIKLLSALNKQTGPGWFFFCAMAIMGTVFFQKSALFGDQDRELSHRRLPSIAKEEVLAIYAPIKLIKFAKANGVFPDYDKLERALDAANLRGYWYGMEVDTTFDNGDSMVVTNVVHPDEGKYLTRSSLDGMAKLSGIQSRTANLDFRSAKIFVLDEACMSEDPMETMRDIREIRVAKNSRLLGTEKGVGSRAMAVEFANEQSRPIGPLVSHHSPRFSPVVPLSH